MPSTWLSVIPYLKQCAPPELNATLPPMVQMDWLDGIRRVVQAVRLRRDRHVEVDDARFDDGDAVDRVELRGCDSSRLSAMTMPSTFGTAPPDRLVPLPRATKGTPRSMTEADGIDDLAGRLGEHDRAGPRHETP